MKKKKQSQYEKIRIFYKKKFIIGKLKTNAMLGLVDENMGKNKQKHTLQLLSNLKKVKEQHKTEY